MRGEAERVWGAGDEGGVEHLAICIHPPQGRVMSLPLQTAAKLVGSLKWHGDGAKSETDEEWKITGVNSLKAAWPSPAFRLTSPVSYPPYFWFVPALPSAKPLSSLSMKRLCARFQPMRKYRLPKSVAKRINNYWLLIWKVQSLVVSLWVRGRTILPSGSNDRSLPGPPTQQHMESSGFKTDQKVSMALTAKPTFRLPNESSQTNGWRHDGSVQLSV